MMSQKKNFVRAPLEKANRERSLHKEENYDRIMEKREQQRSNAKLKNLLKEHQIQFLLYKGMAIQFVLKTPICLFISMPDSAYIM